MGYGGGGGGGGGSGGSGGSGGGYYTVGGSRAFSDSDRTENAPLNITSGAIRFNTDSMKLEYFRIGMEGAYTDSYAGIGTVAAGEWVQITTDTPDIQTGGTRGLRMGGNSMSNVIEHYNVESTGNTIDFGDLSDSRRAGAAVASRTRAVVGGGEGPGGLVNTIEFVTIAQTGNTTDFGDLAAPAPNKYGMMAPVSNSTRGIFSGGYGTPGPFANSNVMHYITIAQTGNSVNFGDLTYATTNAGGCQSSTRGIVAGGQDPAFKNEINFITISTLGNAADFGDLTVARRTIVGGSNAIRGLFAGGQDTNPNADANVVNVIDYITIATLGDATDFGDLIGGATDGKRNLMSPGCSPTRCVWPGGKDGSGDGENVMEYVQIMTTGNAVDFGDTITAGRYGHSGCSNGHGGLG